MFSTKAEANIRYIKSELEALSDSGSLQEISLDPIQVGVPKCEYIYMYLDVNTFVFNIQT